MIEQAKNNNIQTHVLNDENLRKVNEIISKIIAKKETEAFLLPVNYQENGYFDYPKIIKKMMDFQTLKQNLNSGVYQTVESVLDDIQLIWDNCKLYNMEYSKIYKIALILEKYTNDIIQQKFGNIQYGKNNPSYYELNNQQKGLYYEEEQFKKNLALIKIRICKLYESTQ